MFKKENVDENLIENLRKAGFGIGSEYNSRTYGSIIATHPKYPGAEVLLFISIPSGYVEVGYTSRKIKRLKTLVPKIEAAIRKNFTQQQEVNKDEKMRGIFRTALQYMNVNLDTYNTLVRASGFDFKLRDIDSSSVVVPENIQEVSVKVKIGYDASLENPKIELDGLRGNMTQEDFNFIQYIVKKIPDALMVGSL